MSLLLQIASALAPVASGRSFNVRLPQDTQMPAVVYGITSQQTFRGVRGFHGISQVNLQIDCFGKTLLSAYEIKEAAIAALEAAFPVVDVSHQGDTHIEEFKRFQTTVDVAIHFTGA